MPAPTRKVSKSPTPRWPHSTSNPPASTAIGTTLSRPGSPMPDAVIKAQSLSVPCIDHDRLEPALLEDLEHWDPIDPGRFHRDRLYPTSGEPVCQPVKISGEGTKRPDRLFVAVRANRCDVHSGSDINSRRG